MVSSQTWLGIPDLLNYHSLGLITVRKQSCGKVMFSQACVKNSVHGGGVQTQTQGSAQAQAWGWGCVQAWGEVSRPRPKKGVQAKAHGGVQAQAQGGMYPSMH